MAIQSKLKALQDFLGGVGNTASNVSSKLGNYFNPTSNAGNNFWGQMGQASQKLVPGGFQAGVNRVKTGFAQLPQAAQNDWLNAGIVKGNPIIPQQWKPALSTAVQLGPAAYMNTMSKGITTFARPTSNFEKAGDILGMVGANTPKYAFNNLTMGPLSAAFQAGGNILNKQPITSNLTPAYQQGQEFGYKLGPISEIAGTVLKPLLSKLSPVVMKDVNVYINAVKNASTPEIRQQALSLLTKRVLQNVSAKTLEGFVGFAGYGSTMPAKNNEERLKNMFDQGIQGGAFSFGSSVAGMGTQVLSGQVVKPVVEAYKNMTPEQRRAGSVQLGPKPLTAPIDLLVSHEGAPDKTTVAQYKEQLQSGKTLDPIKVIREGSKYGIEDGKHRYQAYVELGYKNIPIEIVGETKIKYPNDMVPGDKYPYMMENSQPQTGGVGAVGGVPEGGMGEAKVPTNQELPVVQGKAILKAKETVPIQPEVKVAGSQSGSLPSGTSIADSELVSKLTNALKEAEPIRGTQEELYSKARSQSLAKMMSARERMAGEKGFFQELGALKGQLPKVQYESIRTQFDQPSVDRLFNMVKETKYLDDWEKINAQVGLAKILGEKGGGVPTKGETEKLYQVFGKEFTETLLSKRSMFSRLGDLTMQAYNLPRSFMAGIGDLSGTLMQNALFAYRHPITTAGNFVQQLKFFASEKAYKMSGEEIASRPTYDLMKKAKLSLTETGPLISQREEQFMSSLAEKIPGLGRVVRATGRAYTGFLNRMRADVFDQLVNTQKSLGGKIDDPVFLKSAGEFINTSTGRGSLGQLERIAPVLGQGFFSARKLVATIQTLNPLYYINAHPVVRREALLTMLSFLGGATAITQLSKLAGAEVGDDPTSTDFGKIKFGNTRFNLYGPYQQIAVLMARLWKGYATSSTTGKKMMLGNESNPYSPTRLDLLTRYFESKEHPTLSLIFSALRGTNNIGQPFNAPTETLNRFIPMVLADGYDLYKEHGSQGLLGLIPGILGIPVQTYGSQIPTIKTTPAGNQTIKLNPVGGIAEDIVSKASGTPISNIPQDQWAGIVAQKTQEQQAINAKAELKKQLQAGQVPTGTQANDLDTAKLMFEYSNENTKRIGDTFLYKDGDAIKTIDLTFPLKEYTPTGNATLDKEYLADYRGSITTAKNNIMKALEFGAITQDEAIAKLDELIAKANKTKAPKKPKKIVVPKFKLSNIKTIQAKKIKLGGDLTKYKLSDLKSKTKSARIQGVKIEQYK